MLKYLQVVKRDVWHDMQKMTMMNRPINNELMDRSINLYCVKIL